MPIKRSHRSLAPIGGHARPASRQPVFVINITLGRSLVNLPHAGLGESAVIAGPYCNRLDAKLRRARDAIKSLVEEAPGLERFLAPILGMLEAAWRDNPGEQDAPDKSYDVHTFNVKLSAALDGLNLLGEEVPALRRVVARVKGLLEEVAFACQ